MLWLRIAVLVLGCYIVTLASSSPPYPVLVSASSASTSSSATNQKPQTSNSATKFIEKENENKAEESHTNFASLNNTPNTTSGAAVPGYKNISVRGGQQEVAPENTNGNIGSSDLDIRVDQNNDDDSLFDGNDDREETIIRIVDNDTKQRKRFLKKRKLKFLNRIVEVSSLLLRKEHDASLDPEKGGSSRKKGRQQRAMPATYSTRLQFDDNEEDNERITQQSDLTRPGRYIHIVTTAALPWMTGTAVNPLLRAAYLHERLEAINSAVATNYSTTEINATKDTNNDSKSKSSHVTLVIPWLELPEDQRQVYNGRVFASKEDQELYVRDWLEKSANMPDAAAKLRIVFYNARYHSGLGSVFAMGDILRELPPDELDVCVLEEPEHLNWYRAPSMESWTKRYNYVVGIVHTNYDQYATQHYSGLWTAPAIRLMSAAMVRAYCHKVIKLSAVVQDFAPEKEVVSNVHGVREEFIADFVVRTEEGGTMHNIPNMTTGKENATILNETNTVAQNRSRSADDVVRNDTTPSSEQTEVYFIGKLLWTKGLDILLEYQDYYKDIMGEYFAIDIYGSGPDQAEITRAYLGRQKLNGRSHKKKTSKNSKKTRKVQSEIEKASKNAFVRAFTWMNRRGKKKKPSTCSKKESSSTQEKKEEIDTDDEKGNGTISVEDIYNDVIDVLESLPVKARESFEGIPSQLRESLDQLSEDVTKAQKSVRGLPAKARQIVNQLIDDLSSRANTFPLPRSLYEFRRESIPATFPGRVDHAILKGNATAASQYKIFVNPSISEVLCTTTAEALAMGKFVIIPVHPSNQFFLKFPNCLGYRNPYEFVANLRWALTHDPTPHTEEFGREFTWEAATDRFLNASSITHREAREREILGKSKIDERIAWLHNEMGKGLKGDIIRKALGAGPVSDQVRYEMTKQQRQTGKASDEPEEEDEADDDDDDMGIDDDDMEDEGLPRKFRNSVFVKALREATATTAID
eukprot:CAMPEP_0172361990 /NCGR_PEP_ID=MMETSP1060-20121228/5718_1 /TAXON_ID=37318 /ORGANISM="Pseudo-nitzschia pungens, Strain cf. cingulata" /LENGTH=976 /DNA_ID=CAMNT_0013084403 /DNA_START=430 /DNA_END=3360 /DNA_ORIENTATION=-